MRRDMGRVWVLGPLGRLRARVCRGRAFAARCVQAAGLPVRDPDGAPLSYRLTWRDRRTVQVLPAVTAGVSPRLRRLAADYELIRNEFAGHRYIDVQPAGGYPPERYLITYHIKGVEALDPGEMPIIRNEHVADIYLHRGYPREKPKCVLRTPIFHPNFGSYICIADHWAPGETLADIIVHIGQMIQYQTYNPESPLDGVAARWARTHSYLFPVGAEPLYQPEVDIRFGDPDAPPEPTDDIRLQPLQEDEPGDDLIEFKLD